VQDWGLLSRPWQLWCLLSLFLCHVLPFSPSLSEEIHSALFAGNLLRAHSEDMYIPRFYGDNCSVYLFMNSCTQISQSVTLASSSQSGIVTFVVYVHAEKMCNEQWRLTNLEIKMNTLKLYTPLQLNSQLCVYNFSMSILLYRRSTWIPTQ
jgi:hypothetical protein